MRIPWRIIARDVPGHGVAAPLGNHWAGIAFSGVAAGVTASFVAVALPSATAPLALLIVFISTLSAGRVAPVRLALMHGACAWFALVALTGLTHALPEWHRPVALWMSFVLVEDMVLIGRVGTRRGRMQ